MTLLHPHAGTPPVLVVGTTTIALYSTTLAQVQAALGATSIVGDKTGINRLLNACYVAGSTDDRVTVQLSALGYVDDHDATMEQRWRRSGSTAPPSRAATSSGRARTPPKRCASLSTPPAEIRWANGLRLGMTRAEVERRLDAPGVPMRTTTRTTKRGIQGLS